MSNVGNKPLYPLPANIPSKTLCLTLQIPDDPDFFRLFYGALDHLSDWFNYDRDPAHTASRVATLWKATIKSIQFCAPAQTQLIGTCDDMCVLRQNPSNMCQLQAQCADGSWVTVFDASLCVSNPAPGSGATQPAPGGGTASDCFTLNANTVLPLPWLVNSGDTITISKAQGAGNDGTNANWYCVDGSQYFLGACVGGGGTVSGDPAPTVNHMRLLIKLGSNYYDALAGTFTVPAGVTNLQPFIQVNDTTIADNPGQYTFCAAVVNNQAAPPKAWHALVDLTRTFKPFTVQVFSGQPSANWVGGVGFEQAQFNNGDFITGVYVAAPLDSCTLTQMAFHCTLTLGDNSNVGGTNIQEGIFWNTTLEQSTQVQHLVNGSQSFVFGPVPAAAGITQVALFLYASDGASVGYKGGTVVINSVDIYGQGTVPSQLVPFVV